MPSTAIDSVVLGDLFGTGPMRQIFSDENRLRHYLEFEAALARAESRCGLIPREAAEEISRSAATIKLDFERLRQRTEQIGGAVQPLVEQLRAHCANQMGQYCHWGATTQDVTDTATVLQIREALVLVERELETIADSLAELAQRYRDAPMAGRTKLQHATPITFGFKAAGLLAAVLRHLRRLREIRPRVLIGQFGGAAGTLAALGRDGLRVQQALMEELGLGAPEVTWHSHRDRFAEVGCFLAIVTGTMGKLATDVKLLMQSEVGEVFEPLAEERGSSSTMPQKRNPISSNYIMACTAMVRQQVGALLESMIEEHERGSGPWEIEWLAIPEIFVLSAGALAHSRYLLQGLEVNAVKMRQNLALTNGLVVSEAVMMGLAPMLGRARAHQLVAEICRQAIAQNRPLFEMLTGSAEVTSHLGRAELESLCEPANYLGVAGEMVDHVLRLKSSFR